MIMTSSPLPWFIPPASDSVQAAVLSASIDAPGISRNMTAMAAQATGGGNLNGSANIANLLGQAGTAGLRISVPRTMAGNYTGVV